MVSLVPSDPAGIRGFKESLAALPWVAVDTEFHAERRYSPKLYLVQLTGPTGEAWLADALEPVHQEALQGLADRPWLVHGGAQDVRLITGWLGRAPTEVLDTQIGASLCCPLAFPASLERCARWFTRREVDKAETMSDWSRRPLSGTQLAYAADDVLILRELYRALDEVLSAKGRRAVWTAASRAALASALDAQPAQDTADRLLAQTGLEGAQAAVLTELCDWRETNARLQDQPPGQLLSDGLLIDLAKRTPITAKSLAANRRIPGGFSKAWASELADLISRTLAREPWSFPKPVPREGPLRARSMWLQMAGEAVCAELEASARLLVPASLCDRLVVNPPVDRGRLAERLGWRDALVGDALWQALQGQGSVRWAPEGGLRWISA